MVSWRASLHPDVDEWLNLMTRLQGWKWYHCRSMLCPICRFRHARRLTACCFSQSYYLVPILQSVGITSTVQQQGLNGGCVFSFRLVEE